MKNKFPMGIISHLEVLNLSTLNKIIRPPWEVFKGGYWFMSKYLGFTGIWADVWDSHIHNLNVAGIRLSDEEDKLSWSWINASEQVTAKESYSAIVHSLSSYNNKWWNSKIWKWILPLKAKSLFLILLEKKY